MYRSSFFVIRFHHNSFLVFISLDDEDTKEGEDKKEEEYEVESVVDYQFCKLEVICSWLSIFSPCEEKKFGHIHTDVFHTHSRFKLFLLIPTLAPA